jgi:hypothetical protein
MFSNTVHVRRLYRNALYSIVPHVETNEGVWLLGMAKEYNVLREKSKENIGT